MPGLVAATCYREQSQGLVPSCVPTLKECCYLLLKAKNSEAFTVVKIKLK